MTRYVGKLMISEWIEPYLDTSDWEYYDLSCKVRDKTNDKTLHDAVAAGKRIKSIFKEPTVTPTSAQVISMNLSKPLPSPNGAMRKGWNGISISRDTIHIDGIDLGFDKPVLFERHAIGGEYDAGWKEVGAGSLITTFYPDDNKSKPIIVDSRKLDNKRNVAVVYHNPLDNVYTLAKHFFERTLKAGVTPYVVTKKTVFKWQEAFWEIHKQVFDENYAHKFKNSGLLEKTNGELQHIISDAATMQIIKWNKGGFGMSSHNYDGDMLTDEVAQVHRSPGFITSNLVGQDDDGNLIKEFEASHGTVSNQWEAHLRGEDTSFNPLGMATALIGALEHASSICNNKEQAYYLDVFLNKLRSSLHYAFKSGNGTRDMAGSNGLTTEEFIQKVAWYLKHDTQKTYTNNVDLCNNEINTTIDMERMDKMFNHFDKDNNGTINKDEFKNMMIKLRLAPKIIMKRILP